MKRLVPIAVMVSAIQVAAAPVATDPHPLEGALQGLAKTAVELDGFSVQNSNSRTTDDLRKEIKEIRSQVSLLAKRAALAPIEAIDEKLKRLGYEFHIENPPSNDHVVVNNDSFESTREDIFQLNKTKLNVVLDLTAREATLVRSLIKVEKSPAIKPAFLNEQADAIARIGSQARLEALDKLADQVKSTISCIDYFSASYEATGLKPIQINSSQVAWSTDSLRRRYGVNAISQLSSKQKAELKEKLQEMSEKIDEYQYACVSFEQAAFIGNELANFDKY